MPVQPQQVAKQRRRDPVEGDIYIRIDIEEYRRVVATGQYDVTHNDEGTPLDKPRTIRRVCYSNGGNTNRWCSLKAFRRWFKEAKLEKDGTAQDR